jgi:small-conductance mechanosensitive channel
MRALSMTATVSIMAPPTVSAFMGHLEKVGPVGVGCAEAPRPAQDAAKQVAVQHDMGAGAALLQPSLDTVAAGRDIRQGAAMYRFVRHRFVAQALVRVLPVLLAVLVLTADRAGAQTKPPLDFEVAKTTLDRIEASVQQEVVTDGQLGALRQQLTPLREELRARTEALAPELARTVDRLKELGDPPAAGATPEDPSLTGERKNLATARAEKEATLKQGRLMLLRADQISARINERWRDLFSRELFTRHAGLFDFTLWRSTFVAALDEAKSVADLFGLWWEYVLSTGVRAGFLAASAVLLVLLGGAMVVRRWWMRRLTEKIFDARFGRALSALAALVYHAAAPALSVAAAVAVLDSHGLTPPRIVHLGFGFAVAVAITGFNRGVALGLFAPGKPNRRLLRYGEDEARILGSHLAWGGRLLALVVFVNVVHKDFAAPVSLTVATSALLAVALSLLTLHLLLRLPRGADGEAARLDWLRVPGWLLIAMLVGALLTGYIGLAAYVAGRVLVAVAMIGATYIAITFVDALFCDVLTGDTQTGRSLAAALGISLRALELVGTLASAVLRILVILLACLPVLGQWGVFAADVFGVLDDVANGVRLGGITISVAAIFAALAVLLVGILATRAAQSWLEKRFLPRTGLEAGLQHSVSALFGYALLIAVLSFTLAQVGLDLEKIAFVAGALSVGIGFGLQSIVSNFVSGLILLAERPIRVGDWVVVKSEEGWVRRISVRATEIETFERATVIVPNSEFITGVVKNWTHSNTMGRVTIKVGVAYDSDVEIVREILLDCSRTHPQVLETPPPRVFLLGFGDSALDFELRCIVANVEDSLIVKSDLHFDVLARFKAAGIVIPYPQREVRLLGSEAGAVP